jgi:hypothetical protein
MKRTLLYVDGFNLYYSAVRGTPLRWLNPVAMASLAFPHNQIIGLRFFTARVTARPGNLGEPLRQAFYWRALRTLPDSLIIEGDFRTREVSAAVVRPPPTYIRVFKTEEKGSDVNLASHLLLDGFRSHYDSAIVISGDSDLITPIRMVRDDLSLPVGVLNPQRLSGPNAPTPRKNAGLQHAASFYQNGVTWNQLVAAQFPDTLTDAKGTFHKPPSWK